MKSWFASLCLTVALMLAAGVRAQTAPTPDKQAVQAVSFENDLRKLFANDGTLNRGTNMMMRTFDNRGKMYEGSPSVFPQWLPADIHLKDGGVLKQIPAKLDVYQAQELMVLRRETGDSLIVDSSVVNFFVLTDSVQKTKHLFRRFPVGDKNAQKFCEVLHEGTYSLIVYHYRTFLPSDIGKAQTTGRYYDKFISHADFFIVGPDKKLIKIRKSRKGLLKALPAQKDFTAYLQANKPDFGNLQSLAAAVAFYNALANQAEHKK